MPLKVAPSAGAAVAVAENVEVEPALEAGGVPVVPLAELDGVLVLPELVVAVAVAGVAVPPPPPPQAANEKQRSAAVTLRDA
jgi:hypothetical protein